MSEQKTLVRAAQSLLRREEVDYGNDALYGAAILLDSYLKDDLTLEDALQEFIRNSEVEIEAMVTHNG